MICPKCGNELGEGNLYCEVCGEEVKFVPDFEPEIEKSISEVMNDVADQIDPDKDSSDQKPEEVDADLNALEHEPQSDVIVIRKQTFIAAASACVALIIICLGLIGFYLLRDNSYDHQMKSAEKAFESQDYFSALNYYEKAFSIDSEKAEPLYKMGKIYEIQGNYPKAEELYGKVVGYAYDQRAMEGLINVYIAEKKYNELNAVLLKYADDDIRLKYIDYCAKAPEFSLEEGTYDDVQELELIPAAEGTVYYTLDGSEPGSDCNLYTGPITLKNGTFKVNAVFVNSMGICSEIVGRTYIINSDVPDDPIVMPLDGSYNVPQLITVSVPEGSNVYYTTDGTAPTNASAIYTDPVAIPQGESTFRFVAINGKGIESEEVTRKYDLEVDTRISQEQAIDIVKNRQFEVGRVITPEGDVPGSEGKYMYSFSELRYIQNRTLFFISEYYQEGTIRMTTGNIFAVDVYDGHIYQAIAGSNNTYTLRDF